MKFMNIVKLAVFGKLPGKPKAKTKKKVKKLDKNGRVKRPLGIRLLDWLLGLPLTALELKWTEELWSPGN